MSLGARMPLAALAALVLVASAQAWGGFTHQRLTQRALTRLAADDEAARKVLGNPRLLAAILGGSMAPDLSQRFLTGGRSPEVHALFHRPAFAEALVEASQDDPEALAMALGWRCHLIQDESAHGAAGYADQKKTFGGTLPAAAGSEHALAEALVDVVCLADPKAPRVPCLLDPARVARAARECGSPLTAEQVKAMWQAFRSSANEAEVAFLAVIRRHKGAFMASLRAAYDDAEAGVPPHGLGLDHAAEATADALGERLPAVVATEEPLAFGAGFIRVANAWQGLESMAASGLLGDQGRSDAVVELLERRGVVARSVALEFMRSLLAAPDADYPSFVRRFAEARRPR